VARGRPRERRRWLQMIFIFDPDPEDTAYVIHARPLTEREKKRERRRMQ